MYNNRTLSHGGISLQLFHPQHKVMELMSSHHGTLVPSTHDLFYVRSKDQQFIMTWNTTTRLVQIWEMDMNTFRDMIMNNQSVDNGYAVAPYRAIADTLLNALEKDFPHASLPTH